MKRIPILLASLLLLAGCTAPAQSTASAPAETAATQAPANVGDVHMLTNLYDGGQYRKLSTPYYPDCVRKIDYATATAQSMCQFSGCRHDSESCPAYSYAVFYQDGDVLLHPYCVYSDGKLDREVLSRYTPDATAAPLFTLSAHTADFGISDDCLAADDQYYYFVASTTLVGTGPICKGSPAQIPDAAPGEPVTGEGDFLFRADKSTGELTNLADLGSVLEDTSYWYLATAGEQKLYFYGTAKSDDFPRVSCYDLVSQEYTMLPEYSDKNGFFADGYYLKLDTLQGTLTAIDPITGQSTLLTDAFPIGEDLIYTATLFRDGWVLGYSSYDGEDWISHQFFRAPDGTLTELPQQMYCDARGTTPVNILDIQNGLVFLQYAYDTVPVSSYDYEGNPYTYDTYLPVYGIIPLQELLAGSQNYRELTFD
ncbi:MAG: hypothetical protein SPJ00_03470 [Gemmiger sp.]|nr:hypothetical protein [Gemmiger sp.]